MKAKQNLCDKWDKRFLELAKFVSGWSKDPSTKCGAVIAQGNRIISLGYNGFARGVDDSVIRYADRDFKYPAVIHAEDNAILFARCNLSEHTLYVWPMPPCARCAAKIIQVDIQTVVTVKPDADQLKRWKSDFDIAKTMFDEAGVILYETML